MVVPAQFQQSGAIFIFHGQSVESDFSFPVDGVIAYSNPEVSSQQNMVPANGLLDKFL